MCQNHGQPLSKNAQIIQQVLDQQGIHTTFLELQASTKTAQEAADAIGCQVAQIAKSLIFKTVSDNQPILVLASGINRVDENKIAAALGEKVVKADATFTKTVTGFAIGGIPPVGHLQAMETFIDADLMQLPELWAAAGTPNAVFCLTNDELLYLTKGKVIDLK